MRAHLYSPLKTHFHSTPSSSTSLHLKSASHHLKSTSLHLKSTSHHLKSTSHHLPPPGHHLEKKGRTAPILLLPHSFISFDVVDFYLSITVDILTKALSLASKKTKKSTSSSKPKMPSYSPLVNHQQRGLA